MKRNNEQRLIDIMFEVAIRCHAGEYDHLSREDFGEYIAKQLNMCGFEGGPVGMSWFSLREITNE